jgi:crotonobetainyl-CoA:carnitine CoA-transferase CaiB-like acyl-CoA transferase
MMLRDWVMPPRVSSTVVVLLSVSIRLTGCRRRIRACDVGAITQRANGHGPVAAPALGDDTAAVLSECLGLSQEEIRGLTESGTVT